jgi:predicted Zn-dependent peptidase
LQDLSELRERDVSEEELVRAQRRHRMFLEFAHDSPGELAGWFGGTEIFRPPESFEERCLRVEAQTPARLREVADRYLRKENLLVVAVGQRKGIKALEKQVHSAVGL